MKKSFFIILAVAALCSCNKKESGPDPSSKLAFKAEIGQLSAVAPASVADIAWAEGDRIAICPVAALADPEINDGKAVAFSASGRGVSAFFTSSTINFFPSSSIATHKFAAAYPYIEKFAADGSDIVPAAVQTVSATGVLEKANVPFFGTAEIASPASGSTVLIRMSPVAAVVGIPVNSAFGPVTSVVLKADGRDIVTVNVASDEAGADRLVYASVEAGKYGKLTASLNSASNTREITLEDISVEKGKVYRLVDNTPAPKEIYSIDLSTVTFKESYIYDAKDADGNVVAVICKEYLDTLSNQQVVTVYGTKQGTSSRVMDSTDPVCLVAEVLLSAPRKEFAQYTAPEGLVHGGTFSFNADNTGYVTPGSSAALTMVYAEVNSITKASTITAEVTGTAVPTTIVPRTLVFSDRGEDYAYKLVKMGRQIWMAENLSTLKFSDGSDITKVTAANLYPLEGPGYVNTASTSLRIMYNVAAIKSDKFLPSEAGWKIPTSGDIKNFCKRLPQSGMITKFDKACNVTLFSIEIAGRITNKGWSETKSLDPCLWSQTASTDSGKSETHTQCMVVRVDPAKAAELNSGQNNHFGFFVRLMRGLY